MLLTLIIIVALIWAAVIWNIYSGFITFYTNFGEIENYNKAYYASIAALERAELVTKQRQPWYDWSGWWINGISSWSYNNWCSDWIIDNNFSYLSRDSGKDSTVFWEIKSSTSRIPREWLWDVDKTLITGDSMDFNILDYDSSETFMLFYDGEWTSENQYTATSSMTKTNPSNVFGKIRLPAYLYPSFGNLSVINGLVTSDIKNDVIVDWQVIWKNNDGKQFTVFSVQNNSDSVDSNNDNTFRESRINGNNGAGLNFSFSWRKTPIYNLRNNNWNVISPIDFSSININNFSDIFSNNNFKEIQIRFSLLNLLKNWSGLIYPYLEYYIQVDNGVIPDKYFNINAEWVFWDYKVNLTIHKPTNKESNLQSFTMILK